MRTYRQMEGFKITHIGTPFNISVVRDSSNGLIADYALIYLEEVHYSNGETGDYHIKYVNQVHDIKNASSELIILLGQYETIKNHLYRMIINGQNDESQ